MNKNQVKGVVKDIAGKVQEDIPSANMAIAIQIWFFIIPPRKMES